MLARKYTGYDKLVQISPKYHELNLKTQSSEEIVTAQIESCSTSRDRRSS